MRAAAALFAIVLATACGDKDFVSPNTPAVAGAWNLESIGGATLPFLSYDGADGRVELTTERLVINDNTFTLTALFRQTIGTSVTMVADSIVGWATVNGSTASLMSPMDGIEVQAVLTDGKLNIDAGKMFVYVRP
jgi:hypothetical protein